MSNFIPNIDSRFRFFSIFDVSHIHSFGIILLTLDMPLRI